WRKNRKRTTRFVSTNGCGLRASIKPGRWRRRRLKAAKCIVAVNAASRARSRALAMSSRFVPVLKSARCGLKRYRLCDAGRRKPRRCTARPRRVLPSAKPLRRCARRGRWASAPMANRARSSGGICSSFVVAATS
ncbi:Ribosome-associated heat shock protein implicated in the recycling of the 50S subunit (S4 paralog), partial [Pseudomonas fluorescens]